MPPFRGKYGKKRCIFWKGTVPVTAFVPFSLRQEVKIEAIIDYGHLKWMWIAVQIILSDKNLIRKDWINIMISDFWFHTLVH